MAQLGGSGAAMATPARTRKTSFGESAEGKTRGEGSGGIGGGDGNRGSSAGETSTSEDDYGEGERWAEEAAAVMGGRRTPLPPDLPELLHERAQPLIASANAAIAEIDERAAHEMGQRVDAAYLAHTSLSARLTESMYSMIGWGRYIDPKEREQLLDGADENV